MRFSKSGKWFVIMFLIFIQELSRGWGVVFEFKFSCKVIISLMQISNNTSYPCQSLKEDTQTCTEASSELATQKHSNKQDKEEPFLEEDLRRGEAKLKYRKLKQKLNSMGFQHDDKCLATKDPSSTKKQRIMKLALDLQKLTKIQNRDYEAIELVAREINRVVEVRKEGDLHLLRQSRFVPALFELLGKIHSLHKAEFSQLLRSLELCFKILHSFASVNANRDYLILTNRLNGLISFGTWVLGRQEKRASYYLYLNVQRLTFQLINSLLQHKSKEEDIHSITNTTVQLILCSQMLKKVKITLCEQLFQDDTLTETDTVLELLRFMLYVLRRPSPLLHPDYSTPNQNSTILGQLAKQVEFVVPFMMGLFHQLRETESPVPGELSPESYPTVTECCLVLTTKILNCCCESAFASFLKTVADSKNDSLINAFIGSCCIMIRYCKRQMQEYGDNPHAKSLLNEVIILLGYLARDNAEVQKKLYDCGLLEELFNLPIHYIMDSYLRDIYIPTFCCLINENKPCLNLFLKDNSPQPLIKALKKEMSAHMITRKASTSSLVSTAHISCEYASANYESDRIAMDNRFPMMYWETLCWELEKHV